MVDASGDFAPNTSDDFPLNMPVVVFVGEATLAFALEKKTQNESFRNIYFQLAELTLW